MEEDVGVSLAPRVVGWGRILAAANGDTQCMEVEEG